MPEFILRIEGVNFLATLDDTNDLSTIRGAGLALLRADRILKERLAKFESSGVTAAGLFSGASQSAFKLTCKDMAEAERVAGAVREALLSGASTSEPELAAAVSHLSFVVDVADCGSGDALEIATARNRTRQLREWTVVLPSYDASATGPDPFDRLRPATEIEIRVPDGKFDVQGIDTTKQRTQRYAPSVKARRNYGRQQRQAFYSDEIGRAPGRGIAYTDDFQSMVARPPTPIATSLRSKFAVLYADGNAFGAIRSAMVRGMGGDSARAFERFSSKLTTLRRALLASLVEWFEGTSDRPHAAFALLDAKKPTHRDLRLETLLWGGDELIFVVPSWLGIALAQRVLLLTKDWEIDGHKLTHALGLMIGDAKTPIRLAKQVAKELAETCKEANRGGDPTSSISIAVFESLSPSDSGLKELRAGTYRAETEIEREALSAHFVIPGDAFESFVSTISQAKGLLEVSSNPRPGFPRSQVYRLLRDGRKKNVSLLDDRLNKDIIDDLTNYGQRVLGGSGFDRRRLLLPRLPHRPERPIAIDLGMLVEYWDYVEPLAPGFWLSRKPE